MAKTQKNQKRPTRGKYRHYKGHEYLVLGIARHSETLEEMVMYQALYDSPEWGKDVIWVRPLTMFFDQVTLNGVTSERFIKVT